MGPRPSSVFPRSGRGLAAGVRIVAACVVALLAAVPQAGADDPVLMPGDLAPDFTMSGTDGRTHTLAEHQGVRPVVLAWFPKAFAKE